MHGCITPSLVKEATSPVKILKIRIIRFSTKKVHVTNLKVTPKMARRIAVCKRGMLWPTLGISEPFLRIFRMYICGILLYEL